MDLYSICLIIIIICLFGWIPLFVLMEEVKDIIKELHKNKKG